MGWLPTRGRPPKGWETRSEVRPPVKGAKAPSKRESNKAAWWAMRGRTCRELAVMRREQRAAIKARVETMCLASGRDPKTGRKLGT